MTENPEQKNTRKPVYALLLSFGATGLGHIYCGQLAKGLTLFFISFAFAPIISTSMESASSVLTLASVIASILILVSVFFYALIDSWKLARKTDSDYQLKEYNRWYIYLLFIIVSVSYPSNMASHIRNHIIQAYKIPTMSMAPGILSGDFIFLNKTVYKKQSPKRGESIVFTYPNDRHLDYIKRIVAMPGDTVEIRNSRLIINDIPLTYQSVDMTNIPGLGRKVPGEVKEEINGESRYKVVLPENGGEINFKKMKVPNGYCFVLGDNRINSSDSRDFGPVPLADVKGRVAFIYFPLSRFGRYRN